MNLLTWEVKTLGTIVRIAASITLWLVAITSIVLTATGSLMWGHTYGVSMEPLYHEGDVVFFAAAETYSIGDVITYYNTAHDVEVVHRIVGGNARDGFIVKGDNNPKPDDQRPTAQTIKGREFLHTDTNTLTTILVCSLAFLSIRWLVRRRHRPKY